MNFKKLESYLRVNLLGPGPCLIKKNLPGRGLTEVQNHCPSRPGPPRYRGLSITFRHTTFGSTPLDVWSARRTDLYLTTHNTHNRLISVTPEGFELAIPAKERT